MAWSAVKQPDGRWAIFSSIVDDWIYKDMSDALLREIYVNYGVIGALDITEDIIANGGSCERSYEELEKLRNDIHGEDTNE